MGHCYGALSIHRWTGQKAPARARHSHGDFIRAHQHVIGCMITTGARPHWPTDHRIVDLGAAGLAHSSVVRWKVFTIPARLLGRRIGLLASADRVAVAAIMDGVLGRR